MDSPIYCHGFLDDQSEDPSVSHSMAKWYPNADTTILINDQGQGLSHRKFIRRWNGLSRLQRTILVAVTVISICIIVISFLSNGPNEEVRDVPILTNSLNNKNGSVYDDSPLFDRLHLQKPKTMAQEETEVTEKISFAGPDNIRQEKVVAAFKHAWYGYKKYAWGHDNLKPVTKMASDWFSLGLTIIDSLDTAYIMNLKTEYEDGKKWVKEELTFTRNKDVNFFEVTIRVLGALLTNYHFSGDKMFLAKAKELGQRLMPAFSSPSGIPYSDVNLGTKTAHAPEWSHFSTTAEVTTIQLEFRELSRITKDPSFEDAASTVSEKIHALPKKSGLVPIFINPNSGKFLSHATITLGARGDSYYEYLLKQWLQTGKSLNYLIDDYKDAIEGVRKFLAKMSSPNKRMFIGELTAGSEAFNPKMDHLTCFLPGTLALGYANGMPEWHMHMAEELIYTCYLTYAAHPTFLAPEITHFNMASSSEDMYTKTADAHSLLRPEFVESLWYMYQITGNTTYQDWGWKVFQAFENYAKVQYGYTSLSNVKSEKPLPRDMMESFFLSETLKYLYLLFSPDRYTIDLNKYVINTEAHPLPIHNN